TSTVHHGAPSLLGRLKLLGPLIEPSRRIGCGDGPVELFDEQLIKATPRAATVKSCKLFFSIATPHAQPTVNRPIHRLPWHTLHCDYSALLHENSLDLTNIHHHALHLSEKQSLYVVVARRYGASIPASPVLPLCYSDLNRQIYLVQQARGR